MHNDFYYKLYKTFLKNQHEKTNRKEIRSFSWLFDNTLSLSLSISILPKFSGSNSLKISSSTQSFISRNCKGSALSRIFLRQVVIITSIWDLERYQDWFYQETQSRMQLNFYQGVLDVLTLIIFRNQGQEIYSSLWQILSTTDLLMLNSTPFSPASNVSLSITPPSFPTFFLYTLIRTRDLQMLQKQWMLYLELLYFQIMQGMFWELSKECLGASFLVDLVWTKLFDFRIRGFFYHMFRVGLCLWGFEMYLKCQSLALVQTAEGYCLEDDETLDRCFVGVLQDESYFQYHSRMLEYYLLMFRWRHLESVSISNYLRGCFTSQSTQSSTYNTSSLASLMHPQFCSAFLRTLSNPSTFSLRCWYKPSGISSLGCVPTNTEHSV